MSHSKPFIPLTRHVRRSAIDVKLNHGRQAIPSVVNILQLNYGSLRRTAGRDYISRTHAP